MGKGLTMDSTLVLRYTFDEDTGSVARDRSPFGNDGKIVEAEYLKELDGRRGVLRFDGAESVLECPDSESLGFGGDMSFEMWVRLNGRVTSTRALIFGDGHSFNFLVEGYISLLLTIITSGESVPLPVDRNILCDRWSHIAVVVEYPRCRFYHNGELVRDAYMPVTGIAKADKAPKKIGLQCPMDLHEFRLYRRALTAAEVAAHARGEEVPSGQELELAVEPHWYDDTVTLRLSCKGTDYSGNTAEMALQKGDYTDAVAPQRAALAEGFEGSGRYVAMVKFPLSGLENRSLDGRARIFNPDGKLVKEVRRHAWLHKPDWVGTREGYSDDVLPPWTPLIAEQNPDGTVEVRVWGRRYVFGSTPFVQHIETRGADILASPITLNCRANDKAIAWRDGRSRLKEACKTAASLEQTFEDDRATLRIDTTIEYDGYMIFDCELKARRDLSVENLTLEIPLLTRHATLCFGYFVYPEDPEIPMANSFRGAVRGDLAFRFSPDIWLGNEERGLCWQAESDQHWHYADEQKAIEILPRGEITTLRAHLVEVPTRLAEGEALYYRFALMATPVKPVLRDSWDFRLVRSEPVGADLDLPDRTTDGKPTLQHYAETGMRHLFTWVNDAWPYPVPVHDKFARALHRLINHVHAHGLKMYNYVIHERFPTNVPEYDIHGLHMSNRPLKSYVAHGPRDPDQERPGPVTLKYGANSQGCVTYCPKSKALQDACVHSLARRLDEYGDDGVYLDGTAAHLVACENTLHGCGYRAEDGSIRPTYPVFASREFIRRIYTLVKQRRPDGIMDVHSWSNNPGPLAYGDMLWTGEQFWHLKGTRGPTDGYVSGVLPLDMFRAEYMGRAIGIAAETLSYRLGPRMKVAAISLLHDLPPRGNTADEPYFKVLSKLWKLRDRFGAKEAEKLFYWENQDYVTVSPEKCYSTLLKHPENGVLAFISNLNRDERTVAAQVNLNKLGLSDQAVEVFNALTDESVAMTADGQLSVLLGSEEWVYVWLRSAGRQKR